MREQEVLVIHRRLHFDVHAVYDHNGHFVAAFASKQDADEYAASLTASVSTGNGML